MKVLLIHEKSGDKEKYVVTSVSIRIQLDIRYYHLLTFKTFSILISSAQKNSVPYVLCYFNTEQFVLRED